MNKARGKSGPLFSFDVHEDVRVISDASVEKDEVSYLHITVWFRMDACELGLLFQCDFERFRSPWPIALSPRPVVEKRGPADEGYRREGDANINSNYTRLELRVVDIWQTYVIASVGFFTIREFFWQTRSYMYGRPRLWFPFYFIYFSFLQSHAGKVVLRSWYERNKHIFPASRWEPYDPEKKWDKYTVSSFFFFSFFLFILILFNVMCCIYICLSLYNAIFLIIL